MPADDDQDPRTSRRYQHEIVDFHPRRAIPLWEQWRLEALTALARVKVWLRAHGLPVPPAFLDLLAATSEIRTPVTKWLWRREEGDPAQEIAPLLDWCGERILRAPVLRGLDHQFCSVDLYTRDERPITQRTVVLDKYGWRRRGRAELGRWLAQTLLESGEQEVIVAASVSGLGVAMQGYRDLYRRFQPPSDDTGNDDEQSTSR